MKKIILLVLAWPLCSYPIYAQKEKPRNNSREIIIIKSGDKEKKLTIETKDGEVFINGQPAAEYKDGDVNLIRNKFRSDRNFLSAPDVGNFHFYDSDHMNGAFLGVSTEKASNGVKVTNVSEGSAAAKAGLKEGDIISKVGDTKISDPGDLLDAIHNRKPKEEVAITYKRDDKTADTKATLGERKYARTFSYNGSNWDSGFTFTMPEIGDLRAPFAMAWGPARGRIGLSIEDAENDGGAKITGVNDTSPAAKAGLKENDVITEVNGKKVKDVDEVKKELAEMKNSSLYTVKAKRNGSDMNFEIKIPKKVNKANL